MPGAPTALPLFLDPTIYFLMVPTFREEFWLSAIGVVEKQRLKLTRTLQAWPCLPWAWSFRPYAAAIPKRRRSISDNVLPAVETRNTMMM